MLAFTETYPEIEIVQVPLAQIENTDNQCHKYPIVNPRSKLNCNIVEKAKKVCKTSGNVVFDHFADISKTIPAFNLRICGYISHSLLLTITIILLTNHTSQIF